MSLISCRERVLKVCHRDLLARVVHLRKRSSNIHCWRVRMESRWFFLLEWGLSMEPLYERISDWITCKIAPVPRSHVVLYYFCGQSNSWQDYSYLRQFLLRPFPLVVTVFPFLGSSVAFGLSRIWLIVMEARENFLHMIYVHLRLNFCRWEDRLKRQRRICRCSPRR